MKYKRLLIALAYQMTGSVTDAEDAVHDVFVSLHRIDTGHLREPKAYLCKMVTNRCLDMLKSAQRRRERYFGEWLPEPFSTAEDEGAANAERSELLSYAMLVLLERLSPAERAVFVLREALGCEYEDIAGMLERSEAGCRKLMSRARGKMGLRADELVSPEAADEGWVRRFVQALAAGRPETVLAMLAEDSTLISDGGGKAHAAVRPIITRENVARFLLGLADKAAKPAAGDGGASPVRLELRSLNGQCAILLRENDVLTTVVLLHVRDNAIQTLFFVRNPDKLARL